MGKKHRLGTAFGVLAGLFILGFFGIELFFPKILNLFVPFCANQISCIKDLTGEYDKNAPAAKFAGNVIGVPREIANNLPLSAVLGNTTEEKRIEVDLSNQRLYAYEGDRLVYDFSVSTGKWHPTPTGTFHIWVKLRYTKMEGGTGSDYYNLPNVPYVMFFYNNEVSKSQGFSVHGAYWHNNFGYPMSHGCVNMRTEDVEKLYYWADPPTNGNLTYATAENEGTKIIISGTPPTE